MNRKRMPNIHILISNPILSPVVRELHPNIAQYQLQLPDKQLLRAKLHELSAQAAELAQEAQAGRPE